MKGQIALVFRVSCPRQAALAPTASLAWSPSSAVAVGIPPAIV
jgi:hypothetical protein